jgi:uncharacterized protein YndB with AHSA1/START domain
MPFVAESERRIDAPPETAFDRLLDHASWSSWMPRSFRPVGASKGALREGDRVRMRVAGMPATIHVAVVRRPVEITWCGGVKGILWAEHRFLFEKDGDGTRVRSVETWHGALAALLRRAIKPKAERIGAEQLASLAKATV